MTKLLSLPIIITALLFILCGELGAAESFYQCSVNQGFNFEEDQQDFVGHINNISIGGSDLESDLSVTDPEDVGNKVKVFGVVSNISWRGGYADPILFNSYVSTENKNTIATLLHSDLSNTEVKLEFTVYSFDPNEKKYYKAFHSDGARLAGLVNKSRVYELDMYIDMDQSTEVMSPRNYLFVIGIIPEDYDSQEIHLAVSPSDKFVKQWGVTVGQ
jgi:hypothetical protein